MTQARFDRRSGVFRKAAAAVMVVLLAVSLTGCLYPDEKKNENRVSYRESVKRIQSALDDFQKDQGILPMINADEDTPKYEKFRINLDQLQKGGYIDEIPATAFEKGGSAYFLIQNEETDPTVKVMDLITVQKVNDVQRAVNQYKSAHGGKLPAGEELYPGIYLVDPALANTKSIVLKSVYSGQDMNFMMDEAGVVYVDYAFDIMQLIDKEGLKPSKEEDLREELVKSSDYVPVKSLAYRWSGDSPVVVKP
ncbi:hypothetical protein P9847_10320 [Paenibacillus chibensis]|uniref:DUF3939 domain-containing protein n=1 Tax=Paenibacillus chibensis TaxID=59846 RepID=A0ABU6PS40_9BACL|nr:hypothetical protein [Paenibacillus chibensis]